MLEEYPMHPLLLKNYAKFLEYKRDLSGAEEYYHKCTVVEPSDGVALANYGRLVMKLHQDEAKAFSYFERSVRASPEDSNVLAAYASFLWEVNTEDNDEDDDSFGDLRLMQRKKVAQASLKQKMEKRYVDTRKRSGVIMVTMRRLCSISRRLLKPLQMTALFLESTLGSYGK